MESMSIPYILQCTIQYNALCHAIKFLSVYCVGFHALSFPGFRATKRLSENLKRGLPAYLADGRLASFGPNEHRPWKSESKSM